MEQKKTGVPLSVRIAYGGGDAAANIVFGMISTILTLFYTDYAGIPAATVGIVMLLARMFDGFSDVIMGYIIEKYTFQIRQGKTMAALDVRTLCNFCSVIIYGTAFHRFCKSGVYVRYL